MVARRYFSRAPGSAGECSLRVLVERALRAISGWARAGGQVGDDPGREALFDELAVLMLTQRATFAIPVWLTLG